MLWKCPRYVPTWLIPINSRLRKLQDSHRKEDDAYDVEFDQAVLVKSAQPIGVSSIYQPAMQQNQMWEQD
jgi:hypothetical protein